LIKGLNSRRFSFHFVADELNITSIHELNKFYLRVRVNPPWRVLVEMKYRKWQITWIFPQKWRHEWIKH
jgi:hypothetical protein